MKVVLADEMGFCFGVERALELIQAAAGRGKPVHTMGDVIHNPQIVADLERRGVGVVERDQPQSVRAGVVAVTAHGARPGIRDEAEALGLEFMDTTCPLVTKVHKLVRRLADENYTIVVYGDASHPEVRGTLGWAGPTAVAAKRVADLPWYGQKTREGQPARWPRKLAVVVQTTQELRGLTAFAQELAGHVLPLGGELRICNTICRPTTDRQDAILPLAEQSDVVLVIGGRKSANTRHLRDIAESCGKPAYHIEGTADIDLAWFAGARTVGITAGASTPAYLIDEVAAFVRALPEPA
ncbi:MAG: 4-hydroxy-3-methylbut-2-enyl diphosphate reductase [Chloroflexi bacterium]|nr:4-hydroxy-3-methylbut-2-enyl diphosphate reductase [Chloroflexota bacterium]